MSDLDEAYRLEYFEEEGFMRKQCTQCGAHFWTRDESQETCGEPPCDDYAFIDDPGFSEEYSLGEMREAFLSFFEDHGHERIDPYPVAANRWRDDVLLTQASIYDFQPLVTSGKTPPPANPLTISQPCIRMQDIDNVGKTGRHTMAFEMMAHHAFNAREDAPEDLAYQGEVYWKDETVELCDDLFAEMGADPEEITYIEDPWVGGGNAGPAFEVLYKGAELATLVFMSMEQDPEGEYEMKDGNSYSPMDTYIVDTGYGLERWTWVSQGTPTVYEAIYPDTIEFLKENAGIELTAKERDLVHSASKLAGRMDIDEIEHVDAAREEIADKLDVETETIEALLSPLEDIYAIADHARTLAYMFGDGIVPSNVGTGYLARMVLRRTKRLADDVGVDAPIEALVDMQADRLGYDNRDTIREMVSTEVEKYEETLERGGRRVRQIAQDYADEGRPIPKETLVELYDSHGIQPEMVEDIAEEVGATVDVPDDFYSLVAQRHDTTGAVAEETATDERLADLPATERLFYDDQYRTEFEAVILDVFEREDGYDVVLDQTMFYPEGGGQPADHGTLSTSDTTVEVRDVQREGEVILHRTDEKPSKGEFVRGQIDVERRRRLMRHHTATHIVIHAARQVLGDHIRQAGAQKGTDSSRIDVTHFRRLDRETIKEIERLANDIVLEDLSVQVEWPDRHEAEEAFGFDLYQGGIPAGENIRLVHVGDDVQACGGTHVQHTGEIGSIKILSTERVQDGVERITFAAGEAATEHVQAMEDDLLDAAEAFDVSPEEVPATADRFFSEWKERGKRIEELKEELAAARASGGSAGEEVTVGDTTAVVQRVDTDMDELRATANAIVEEGKIAVVASGRDGAQFVVAVPDGSDVNAGEVVGELASQVGGGGGGPPDFAQGGGPEADALEDALAAAPDILRRVADV
ncbi:alanine--tRNA ligase [Halanaeroarchaeum sulfurireducens]|uniref:Alanine--tRNA ligase n=1 Tax=Halanaeroarchaeum sulfurireducens TaxID=1604004 RepID=A0A0N9MZ03_9EURY|nr:alanine--tRNA ligase [Halanaeroarchaeum sulfurireducens]ALG82988.1 alanyl-tRNA synthetase [Halanaeroarchaeum sulfurireducens]